MQDGQPWVKLLELVREVVVQAEVLRPLLPHVVRLVALAPRLMAVARSAVEGEGRAEGIGEVVAPLAEEAAAEVRAMVGELLDRDALVIEAVEQLGGAVRALGESPEVLRALDGVRERALDASDSVLAHLVDHAFQRAEDPRVGRAVAAFEAVVQTLATRAMEAATRAEEGEGRAGEGRPRKG